MTTMRWLAVVACALAIVCWVTLRGFGAGWATALTPTTHYEVFGFNIGVALFWALLIIGGTLLGVSFLRHAP
jgi:hypothetical protein